MNKTELIDAMSTKCGLTKKDTAAALDAFTNAVSEALKAGDKVQLIGFGTFETTVRAARDARNPRTGEVIKIPQAKSPKFKAGKALKDSLN